MSFFTRHPYYKNLLKAGGYTWVIYNVLAFSMLGPLFALIFFGALVGGASKDSSSTDTAGLERENVYGSGYNELLSLKISGPILGEADESPFSLAGETYGYELKKQLIQAVDEDNIKGVVLEINSPGGTIYGAHAIADGVTYFKNKTHKPVYAYIQGVGASGAYWAAVSSDKIYADFGSDIGSIGVIMGPFQYYDKPVSEDGGLFGGGVVTQNGIETQYITAGKSKDVGSPYRRLTPDEISQLQQQVNNDYDVFVGYVSERRSIPEATIRGQIGAMAYDNKTAKSLHLIDETASREDVYNALAEKAGVKADFQVTRVKTKGGFWSTMLGAVTGKPAKQASTTQPAGTACATSTLHLAYAGNVTDLCTK
jgi:protease-4